MSKPKRPETKLVPVPSPNIIPERDINLDEYRMLVYAIVLILVMIATNNPVMRGFFNGIKEKFRKLPEQPAEKGGVSHE